MTETVEIYPFKPINKDSAKIALNKLYGVSKKDDSCIAPLGEMPDRVHLALVAEYLTNYLYSNVIGCNKFNEEVVLPCSELYERFNEGLYDSTGTSLKGKVLSLSKLGGFHIGMDSLKIILTHLCCSADYRGSKGSNGLAMLAFLIDKKCKGYLDSLRYSYDGSLKRFHTTPILEVDAKLKVSESLSELGFEGQNYSAYDDVLEACNHYNGQFKAHLSLADIKALVVQVALTFDKASSCFGKPMSERLSKLTSKELSSLKLQLKGIIKDEGKVRANS